MFNRKIRKWTVVTVSAAALFFATAFSAAAQTCAGEPCEFIGTEGNDVFFSSTVRIYCSFGGDDLLFGNNLNNKMCLGTGNDEAHGHDGRDVFDAGSGSDEVSAGPGNDRILTRQGPSDYVAADIGNDELEGGWMADELLGEGDHDEIYGAGGNDLIFGGSGDDYIDAGPGTDTVDCGPGNDTVWRWTTIVNCENPLK